MLPGYRWSLMAPWSGPVAVAVGVVAGVCEDTGLDFFGLLLHYALGMVGDNVLA